MSLLTVLTAMISVPVSAQKSPPDVSYEASKSRLLAEGCSDVRIRNDNPLYLSARNLEGREVPPTVNKITGKIGSPDYNYDIDVADDIIGG